MLIIENHPFTQESLETFARPFLDITIKNPSNGKIFKTKGLIDTGADLCAFPPYIVKRLGYVWKKGKHDKVITAQKMANVYAYPTIIIFDHYPSNPASGVQQFSTGEIMVNYQEDLHIPLLGVENFLSSFILTMDYRKRAFSLDHQGN